MPNTFVTYAQNLEDVILWRALGHVQTGFYIDVGAASPTIDSVTRAFYERGWHGINVEPHPEEFRALAAARPRDTNLNIALGDTDAEAMTMSLARHAALSTLDADEAARLATEGMPLAEHVVAVRSLRSVWSHDVPTGKAVHFLKVDVEGFERRVILGNDWSTNRPWVVVVEATRPQRQEPSHGDWEDLLLTADYQFVYDDGLNRFYVADEHAELMPAFRTPPSVFDRYVRASERTALLRVAQLEGELADLRASKDWRWMAALRFARRAKRHVAGRIRNPLGRRRRSR